jgi:hypothetical protein
MQRAGPYRPPICSGAVLHLSIAEEETFSNDLFISHDDKIGKE